MNVAAVLLAALVPFTLNVGAVALAGIEMTDHVYVRLDCPISPTARTAKLVVAPVTIIGEAVAAVAMTCAELVTVSAADPEIEPLLAVTE